MTDEMAIAGWIPVELTSHQACQRGWKDPPSDHVVNEPLKHYRALMCKQIKPAKRTLDL
jgi:hypothetical protein